MASGIGDAYSTGHTDFEITNIEYEKDASRTTNPINNFSYGRPSIGVDTAGRFAKHEIVGGSTVRQKIGEDPIEVSINGVCVEERAKDLDGLRDAKFGTIKSKRLPGETLDCHFASVSTSPLEDGGAASFFGRDDGKAEQGDFLYTFTLECVEVVVG
jgi:hypothetical protein